MSAFFFKKDNRAKKEYEEILQKVKEAIARQLGIKEETITPESNLINDLGIDSLAAIELVLELEEVFGVAIPDEDAERIETVKDIIDFINTMLKKRSYQQ